MFKQCTVLALVTLAAAGCTTIRETQPTQTAREQLMMSSAADYASAKIKPNLPRGDKIYVDTSQFSSQDEYRDGYAIAAVDAALLSDGYRLVGSQGDADTVAVVGNGALSVDSSDTLFGLPSIPIPIPLTGTVKTPEIALYKKSRRTGVSKLLIAFYDAKTGDLQDVVGPVYGFSHDNRSSLLGYGWTRSNLVPQEDRDQLRGEMPKPAPSTAPVGGGQTPAP